jgi:hypothetical protein
LCKQFDVKNAVDQESKLDNNLKYRSFSDLYSDNLSKRDESRKYINRNPNEPVWVIVLNNRGHCEEYDHNCTHDTPETVLLGCHSDSAVYTNTKEQSVRFVFFRGLERRKHGSKSQSR